jgi:hypothetical protein
MSGLGNSALGTSPFGLGTPVAAAVPPTGKPGSRFIDPRSRDYQIDTATGQLAQMPAARQRVLLALMTVKRSSSVLPNFGIALPGKIDQAYQRRVTDAVRVALRHLTDVERVIRVDSVLVGVRPLGLVTITVAYTDLSNGKPADPLTV